MGFETMIFGRKRLQMDLCEPPYSSYWYHTHVVNRSCLKLRILPFLSFQKNILIIGHIKILMNMTEVHFMLSSPIKKIWGWLIRHLKAEIPYFRKIKFWSTFSQQVLTKSRTDAFVGKYMWKSSSSTHMYEGKVNRCWPHVDQIIFVENFAS